MFNYFYSDPHFGHANIIKYCDRPYKNTYLMNKDLIDRFNARIDLDTNVLWIGDCFFCGMDEAKRIFSSLRGNHYLVYGNHDKKPHKMCEIGFKIVTTKLAFRDVEFNRQYIACHFPTNEYYQTLGKLPDRETDTFSNAEFAEYDKKFKDFRPKISGDEILLHGHVHIAPRYHNRCVNISADSWEYSPVSSRQVNALLFENRI